MTIGNVGLRRLPSSALTPPILLPGLMVITPRNVLPTWCRYVCICIYNLSTCYKYPQVAILPGQSGNVLVHKALDQEKEEEEKKAGEMLVDQVASVLNTGNLRLQQLVAHEERKEEIFFTAEDPEHPGSSHLYSLPILPSHPSSSSSSSSSSNSSSYLASTLPSCLTCQQNDPTCLSSRFTPAPKVIKNPSNTGQRQFFLQDKTEKGGRDQGPLFIQECLGPGIPKSRVIRAPTGEIVTRYKYILCVKLNLFRVQVCAQRRRICICICIHAARPEGTTLERRQREALWYSKHRLAY